MVARISDKVIFLGPFVGLERVYVVPWCGSMVLSGPCGRENVGGGVVVVAGRGFPWAVLSYAAAQAVSPSPSVPWSGARNRISTGS